MSADRVPTLTEVVELKLPAPAPSADDGPGEVSMNVTEPLAPQAVLPPAETDSEADQAPDPAADMADEPKAPVIDVDAIVGQVLSELLPRIDMLLESRLREALAPALARAADGLIRDTRSGLSVAVRDLVQEAVDRALQRRADL